MYCVNVTLLSSPQAQKSQYNLENYNPPNSDSIFIAYYLFLNAYTHVGPWFIVTFDERFLYLQKGRCSDSLCCEFHLRLS